VDPVISATNAGDALEKAAKHAAEISLLLTDVTMPGMNGFELGREINNRHPSMKVIYTSGYTADRVALRDENDVEFWRRAAQAP